ncbi:hypothetical protein F1880_000274 [Penicillium rolfsii]|nr:hypothetical protein F1880_000274 [Penicillium rolfsii]
MFEATVLLFLLPSTATFSNRLEQQIHGPQTTQIRPLFPTGALPLGLATPAASTAIHTGGCERHRAWTNGKTSRYRRRPQSANRLHASGADETGSLLQAASAVLLAQELAGAPVTESGADLRMNQTNTPVYWLKGPWCDPSSNPVHSN